MVEVDDGVEAKRNENCIVVQAREWFERDDFWAFLQGESGGNRDRPATWLAPGEGRECIGNADVFVWYDSGEGSDDPYNGGGCPEDIWDQLGELADEMGVKHALFWIQPI